MTFTPAAKSSTAPEDTSLDTLNRPVSSYSRNVPSSA